MYLNPLRITDLRKSYFRIEYEKRLIYLILIAIFLTGKINGTDGDQRSAGQFTSLYC